MKKILTVIIILATYISAHASSILERADSAYNNLSYAEARYLYESALDSLGGSADLYYNIGNTYYRLNEPGRAILWYERALKLDPTHADARTNLEFVNTTITDKPVDNRSLLQRKFQGFIDSARPDTWAWIATGLFVIAVSCVVIYLIGREVKIRKISFFGGLISLGLAIFFVVIASKSASLATRHDHAIVVVPAAHLSTTPRRATDSSTQAFLLHEGTKIELIDSLIKKGESVEKWYEVKVGDTGRAWIIGEDIEII